MFCQPDKSYQAVLQQAYQSASSHYVYYMKEKAVYQINNKPNPEIEEDDPNRGDAYYTNKSFEELLVNFVEIESSYDRFDAFF